MDVSISKQHTGRKITAACHVSKSGVSGRLAGAVTVFSRCFVIVLLVYGGTATVNAAPTVPPLPKSDWEYSYVRCNTWQGPFETELEAATTGMNSIYGSCGDQYIYDWGRWGTLQEGVQGPCGSTKYHPSSRFDFVGGVEVYNNRKLKISYCNGILDGLRVRAEITPFVSSQPCH